jgi:DNA-binding Xre family transcriptional regulator
MKKDNFIDFVNKTGKNIGKIQNTKLANFLGISEGAIRLMKEKDLHRLDCNYLGALCKINNIKKEDLIKLVENKE